ncbi:heterodisulfide reductase, subunit A/methylviologen reducing hydrogenase, subunit delta [Olavius sp. associated proteobacterium Delta 1]|nr:heterodisulfide reductase, subunit A/methylviologen reducing hydrogenase, subunit delta [Olavius sp. associated proteobacterium Delta 1]
MDDEEIRIGVFVCDCGTNIAGVVNVPQLVDYAMTLENVVFADEGRWSCSVDYLSRMKELIQDNRLNRIVISACTPRTHEPLFKRTAKEAGVNPYLLEFVSIREQVSWVHMKEPDIATDKAKDLIKMGVAKAALLEEGQEIRLPVKTDCLIIGGGMAGMNAALSVANQGFNANLVEKESRLGGILNQICFVSHDNHKTPAVKVIQAKVNEVESNPNINVYTDTDIEAVDGYIGNYKVKLKTNGDGSTEELDISTVIVATGMAELEPEGQFEYGNDSRVITQLQLDSKLKDKQVGDVKDVVMISCVNSKNEQRGCCSVGCHASVKNAVALKHLRQDANVHILYRDMSLIKEEGTAQQAAKRLGVKFLRFPDDRYPEVVKDNGDLVVKVYDLLLGREINVPADLLVLTTAFKGNETVEQIKGHLKVSGNPDGFFQESHVKLGPLEFATDGVSLAGCAKAPMTFKESCEEGIGAAMKASIPMKKGYIEAEGIVADIDLPDCTQCGLCSKRCPYNAIEVDEEKNPEVIKALCKGCGLCAADCPQECISIVHYSDEQVFAQVEAALEAKPEKKIVAFVCHWCALGGVDMAGVSRLQYPSNARLIRVMCSARVSMKMMQRPFELGAAGVLVAGCEFPTCHYITGNYAAEKRVNRSKKKIAKAGFDPEKLWNIWCSAADGPKFANTMRDMTRELGLG